MASCIELRAGRARRPPFANPSRKLAPPGFPAGSVRDRPTYLENGPGSWGHDARLMTSGRVRWELPRYIRSRDVDEHVGGVLLSTASAESASEPWIHGDCGVEVVTRPGTIPGALTPRRRRDRRSCRAQKLLADGARSARGRSNSPSGAEPREVQIRHTLESWPWRAPTPGSRPPCGTQGSGPTHDKKDEFWRPRRRGGGKTKLVIRWLPSYSSDAHESRRTLTKPSGRGARRVIARQVSGIDDYG